MTTEVTPTPAAEPTPTPAPAAKPAADVAPPFPAATPTPTPTPDPTPTPSPTRPSGGLNDEDLGALGIPGLGASIDLVRSQYPTLDLERALGNAVNFQNPSLIDSAYIRDVVGANADIIINHLTSVTTSALEHTQGVVQGIFQSVGGEAQWAAMAKAFNETAPKLVVSAVRAKLDSGNMADIQEAVEFVQSFSKDSGLINTPATRHNPSGGGGGGEGYLTKEQYVDQIRELNTKRDITNAERLRLEGDLEKRRALSIQAGY